MIPPITTISMPLPMLRSLFSSLLRPLPPGLPWRLRVCVRQLSPEDCGAACLATACRSHGHSVPISLVRQQVGTTAQGTSLLSLRRGAEQLGFQARAARGDSTLIEHLEDLPLPLLCHWRGDRWVVLHGRRQSQLLVADPAVGLQLLSPAAFLQEWQDGIVLLLEPDPIRFPPRITGKVHTALSRIGLIGRSGLSFRSLLTQVVLLNLILGLIALAMPLVMQILTDHLLVRADDQILASLAVAIVGLFFFRALNDLPQNTPVIRSGRKLPNADVG